VVVDVGCGTRKREVGAIGLDRDPGGDADIVCDLENVPWPIRDNVASKVYLSHVVEHLHDVVGAMAEVSRICRHGARVIVETPHFSSVNSYIDPTHCQHLSWFTFDLLAGRRFSDHSQVPFELRIVERKLLFHGNFPTDLIGKVLARISMYSYELRCAWMFPASNIYCEFEVIKDGHRGSE